uniref:Uncharacterized protein n=1 Tax=Ascaris lumbricoides TaxID=6252 RepID=A0A0M3HTN2_ASCLU
MAPSELSPITIDAKKGFHGPLGMRVEETVALPRRRAIHGPASVTLRREKLGTFVKGTSTAAVELKLCMAPPQCILQAHE